MGVPLSSWGGRVSPWDVMIFGASSQSPVLIVVLFKAVDAMLPPETYLSSRLPSSVSCSPGRLNCNFMLKL
jgi:hypothetical protein